MIWGKNLVYRFIIMISRSSLILGSIEQFLTELCTFDLKKIQIFPVSVHFLCRGLEGSRA